MADDQLAPGAPGARSTWTSGAKQGIGTSLSRDSRCWFTIGRGIVNEVYWPRLDCVAVRDAGFLVTDGQGFFSEDKTDAYHEIQYAADGIPAFQIISRCKSDRYRIEKDICTSPYGDCLLQHVKFISLHRLREQYHLYLLVNAHLANAGGGNRAWVGEHEGQPALFAEHEGDYLAVLCSHPFLKCSVGYVGVSDGWQDVHEHNQMTWSYKRAENGNVALTAELDLRPLGGENVVAIGFGTSAATAAAAARKSLDRSFDAIKRAYVADWRDWQRSLKRIQILTPGERDLRLTSAAVIRTQESLRYPGGIIASLSIPWGFARGDDQPGGYHLVWTRDLVEMAGGLIAVGAFDDARRALRYLEHTQHEDGHWPQNMWIDGSAHYTNIQIDETALPILLVSLAQRERCLREAEAERLWPMIRKAAAYIVRNGPATQQDRWEHNPGYSVFTLAVEVAALLAAAEHAEAVHETALAVYLRETADLWNASIEDWTYVEGTELARRIGVSGYYLRIVPPREEMTGAAMDAAVASDVSPDALALVRFGLRPARDPRILNTVRAIDAMLRVETPAGPCWRRYPADSYGEHEDGSPYDGTGRGRPWPVLAGERAHYEVAAGERNEARRLLAALSEWANAGLLIPEQIWDGLDIPERGLFFGRATGSAMPLGWAHAEYLKLRRSLADGDVFDVPWMVRQRYAIEHTASPYALWRFNCRPASILVGRTLRVEVLSPAVIHYSDDGWGKVQDVRTWDSGVGVHVADLPTARLPRGSSVVFSIYWPDAAHWEGQDFEVRIGAAAGVSPTAIRS